MDPTIDRNVADKIVGIGAVSNLGGFPVGFVSNIPYNGDNFAAANDRTRNS